jgi:hypothetical protein
MDAIKTVREIGTFMANENIVKFLTSEDVRSKVGAVMPLPSSDFLEYMNNAAEWIASFGKSKYMFFSPEIALIEKLPSCKDRTESIIMAPCDMDHEIKSRLKENLPRNMKVVLLDETKYPESVGIDFRPRNGIIVISGYLAGERIMVLPETYRLINSYGNGFMGKTVFVPYTTIHESTRYADWLEVGADKFNEIWRNEA